MLYTLSSPHPRPSGSMWYSADPATSLKMTEQSGDDIRLCYGKPTSIWGLWRGHRRRRLCGRWDLYPFEDYEKSEEEYYEKLLARGEIRPLLQLFISCTLLYGYVTLHGWKMVSSGCAELHVIFDLGHVLWTKDDEHRASLKSCWRRVFPSMQRVRFLPKFCLCCWEEETVKSPLWIYARYK
jgi:hypothetical protein